MLQGIKQLKRGVLEIEGEKYFDYTYNFKYKSDKWIVWNGIHYYQKDMLYVEE